MIKKIIDLKLKSKLILLEGRGISCSQANNPSLLFFNFENSKKKKIRGIFVAGENPRNLKKFRGFPLQAKIHENIIIKGGKGEKNIFFLYSHPPLAFCSV